MKVLPRYNLQMKTLSQILLTKQQTGGDRREILITSLYTCVKYFEPFFL